MKSPRSPLAIPIALFLVLILLISAAGWQYFRQGEIHVKRAAAVSLVAVADLKVLEILNWREERLDDAAVVSANPFNDLRIIPFLEKGSAAAGGEAEIKAWLDSLVATHGFMDAVLLDADGRVRLSSGSSPAVASDYARANAALVCASGLPLLSDFHRVSEIGTVHLDLYAPVLGAGKDRDGPLCAGVFVFQINPRDFLYPLIQNWPVPSRSAETLLVRREGGDVLFLNDLLYRKNTALTLRFPADSSNLPAAMAVRGVEGMVEGMDYRGVRVLSVIRPLRGTPWFMIAKEDLSEIFAPLRLRSAFLAFVFVILCFGIAGAFLFWIRRREAHYYKKQYEIEHDRLAMVQHFEYLHKYANDIIFLSDQDHRIVESNERAGAVYGYGPEELKGMRVSDLRPLQSRPEFSATMREAEKTGGLVFETVHQRKDGTVFPIEVSMRILDIDGERYHQAIIRDISERKKAEERIMEALREKDVLLREIHHRVKNNMQVISSLLSLQSQRFPDAEVREAFRESQDRIRSMALIHEKLYQTRDLSRIDFSDYIKGLTSSLFRTYQTDTARIALKLDLDKAFLDINAAIPCGLVLNELMLNALKHAFPGERKGEITVELHEIEDGLMRLTVRDNGVGFPEGIDIEHSDTLGLQIVTLLTEQLDGRIEVRRDGGTAFTLSFKVPNPKYEPRV
ncbi:MAG TPA: histidine kinase dimerization/phosphoacceptor domain -containing protein [Acidobacteriota bacterium]|nr:histidine kinase dimerization/phosphoacceptor domain -containing protein [Acidobacteriota bacterium]